MTKQKKNSFWKETKSWLKQPKIHMKFTVSIGFIFILLAAIFTGAAVFSVNYSTVKKLRHYTLSSRSNDMFNPLTVETPNNKLIIEIEYEFLTFDGIVDPTDGISPDPSDVWIVFGRCPEPIVEESDFPDFGEFIGEKYFKQAELDDHCDTPNGNYLTRFYYEWYTDLPTLEQGFVYCIYMDFIDANAIHHYCPAVYKIVYGEMPPGDITGDSRISIFGTNPGLGIQGTSTTTDCDYVSFFKYVPENEDEENQEGDQDFSEGNYNDGIWTATDNFFKNLQEQFEYNPTVAWTGVGILAALLLIILLIAIALTIKSVKNNSKNNKNKSKGKK